MDRVRPGSSGDTRDQASGAVAADAGGQARCRIPSGAVVRDNLVTERRSEYALSTGRTRNGAVNIGDGNVGRGGPAEVAGFHMDRVRPGLSGDTRDQAGGAVGADAGGQARCRIPSGVVVRDNLVAEWHSNYALRTGRTSNGAVSNGHEDVGRGG